LFLLRVLDPDVLIDALALLAVVLEAPMVRLQ
jgi:hypothetical protein